MDKFPIYQVEFVLYPPEGGKPPARCSQKMMLPKPYTDHAEAIESLHRMQADLQQRLELTVVSSEGSVTLLGEDTWCLHWNSHYTYKRYPTPADALASFVEYKRRHPEEVESDLSEWFVCPCNTCKELGRTVILHWSPSCSYVW